MKNDLSGVDVAKFFFCLCVVALHGEAFLDSPPNIYYYITKLLLYPAVPFFFVASGFFLQNKIESVGVKKAVKEYCSRIIPILVLFESISLAPVIIGSIKSGVPGIQIVIESLQSIIFYPGGAMWFMQACIVGALIIYLLEILKCKTWMKVAIGLMLYSFALLSYSYSFLADVFGFSSIIENYRIIFISARNGLFFGYPMIGIGCLIKKYSLLEKASKEKLDIVLLISAIMLIAEVSVLKNVCNSDDVVISELLFAPTLFLRISIQHTVVANAMTRLMRTLSVGIYALHRPLLIFFAKAFTIVGISTPNYILSIIVSIIAVFICMVSYKFIPRIGGFLQ